jgi:archaellum component FlaC
MRYGEHQDKLYPIEEQLLPRWLKDLGNNTKDLSDKIDCLQKTQIYIHNHINRVENTIDQLVKIIRG